MRADFFNDGVEGCGIDDREFAEHLAIEFDAGQDERGDESVVVYAAGAEGRTEPGDPEGSEMPLALAAVAVCVYAGLAGEFDRRTIERSGCGAESAGGF